MELQIIQKKIYEIRGQKVMLDFDLADLYDVETRVLNQAVKRNIDRFPGDFMFRLKSFEFEAIRFQMETIVRNPSSQIVMISNLPQNRTNKYLPYAFTEQGVAMLSGILNSEKAIKMNIAIMRAFVRIRRIILNKNGFKLQLQKIKKQISNHDLQISEIYDAIENLIDEKTVQRKWEDRVRIGFKK